MDCRHCGKTKLLKARGLCANCHSRPHVRWRYASQSKYAQTEARLGVPADFMGLGEPTEPTDAIPGTSEKKDVLRERVQRRQQLHHPEDATLGHLRFLRRFMEDDDE